MEHYQIYPMLAGVNAAPADKLSLVMHSPLGVGVPLYNGSFAIKAGNEWILVDAGTADNDVIGKIGKPQMREATPFLTLLSQRGIDPLAVRDVVLTHLHWDHAWNLDALPNATFYVQRKELTQAVAPYPHEHSQYGYYPGVAGYEQPLFVKHLTQMTVLDGEYELRPGITIIPTPGHTHGSQSVLVDTPNGRYAITGDFCFLQENWTTGIMIGRYSSCQEWYGSYRYLKSKHPDFILTTHDALTYSREVWD